jgi:hypothetical protein
LSKTHSVDIVTLTYPSIKCYQSMKYYIKNFSKREILSALFSSLMLVSFYFLLRQFDLYDNYYILVFLSLSLPLILSHRFYLLEHKCRNRLMGRIIHDLIISAFTILVMILTLKVSGMFYKIGYYTNLVFVVLIIVYFVELFLTLLNRIFILIGWRIW